ncbi:hypothetical protein BJ912DRAFT_1046348, partial [Pholiota molesta]
MVREAAQRHGIAPEDVDEFLERAFRGDSIPGHGLDYGQSLVSRCGALVGAGGGHEAAGNRAQACASLRKRAFDGMDHRNVAFTNPSNAFPSAGHDNLAPKLLKYKKSHHNICGTLPAYIVSSSKPQQASDTYRISADPHPRISIPARFRSSPKLSYGH